MNRILVWMACLAGAVAAFSGCGGELPEAVEATKAPAEKEIRVYYFHRTARCPGCLKIESLAQETVQTSFPIELENGMVTWHSVNVDDDRDAHFVDEYDLSTQSVVIAEYSGNKQLRWKNLDKVWELLDADVEFSQYVESEIRAWTADS